MLLPGHVCFCQITCAFTGHVWPRFDFDVLFAKSSVSVCSCQIFSLHSKVRFTLPVCTMLLGNVESVEGLACVADSGLGLGLGRW